MYGLPMALGSWVRLLDWRINLLRSLSLPTSLGMLSK